MLNEMKSRFSGIKIIFLIALFFSVSFGQGWNNTVTTTINESTLEKMDLFTNADGNHLLIKKSNGNIVYYNLNSAGTVDGSKTETLVTSGDFPNIVGSNDKLYALYKSGNYIKGKYSTNGGDTWTALTDNSIGSNDCNGIDAVFDDSGIHVVWATQESDPDYETYYEKISLFDHSWIEGKTVTDYGSEVGGIPSVTVSSNRIHVSYNSDAQPLPYIAQGVSKTRDKYGSNWQTPQLVSDGEVQYGTSGEKLQVRDDKLFAIFYDFWVDLGQYGTRIQVKSRDLTATSWPGSYTQIFSAGSPQVLMGVETTANGKLNVVHYDFYGIQHIDYDGSSWSDEFTITSDYLNYESQNFGFSITSDDMFTVWKPSSSSYLKYRQYDAAPLTPSNFAGTIYNNHPKLTWTLNNEPDMSGYEIYRLLTSGSGVYELLTTVSSGTSSYVDNGVQLGGSTMGRVFYKIRAKDNHPYYSGYTPVIRYNYSGLNKVTVENQSFEYLLSANYPNPFNPSTQIKYSLAQDADVTLKVFDMLGKEVAKLVNETQAAGSYEINFNASNLSSGVYIYRITATNNGRILFTDSKQMILLR